MDDDHGELLADRYQLTSLLGRGGMGAVWRAYDLQLGRDVAVKELRLPEHLGAEERATWMARLDREARAAARLKHPGIVTVYDRIAGVDGRPWIVMELVTGGSLDDLLRQGPLSPEHVAELGRQVAAALSTAHQRGITHRDIKPANILIEDGRAVLTDFGIAGLEGDATLTATGMIMGTPAFMAPEQVRGLPATAASDLWSLGATLYTAVEGRPPFAGSAPSAVLVAVVTETPAPAVRAGPLTPTLEGLLHKEPAQRLSMEQLLAQLDRIAGQPPAPHPLPADPARWPTAPAQPPAVPSPRIPARSPAATPAVDRRRLYRRVTWTGAAVVAVVASSFLARDSGDAEYQDNREVAEAMGHPPDFTVDARMRGGGDWARVVYAGGPISGDPTPGQWDGMAAWLEGAPGVETAGIPSTNPTCMTDTVGCVWGIDRRDGFSEPTILSATTRQQDGELVLEIEVGSWN
ncbi:Serine/threonine protein kinase [Streptomyces zhaozhouensis]|uniref:non-specific serine/threonine protein kinase n=1 Tax=Streptomyces zhaozhouensis TaxID=1300267 RepID=A0A286DVR8_9ACTN|nr:serine/threonine-protein kinase [Streptomyces zhaozhouensis]SOD62771.1 Serine/threonine protein kinase [Streptomyces zhaozhouensis]